jgi:hypothetical protein
MSLSLSQEPGTIGKKLSLSLIKHHAMKKYEDVWEGGVISPPFTSAIDGSEWLASRPAVFPPGEQPPVLIG